MSRLLDALDNVDAPQPSQQAVLLQQARMRQASGILSTPGANAAQVLSSAITRSPPSSPPRAGTSQSGKIRGAGGFNLNYDQESMVRSIDVGGPDQQQRLAEFVTRSIDNVSHGLTVRTAMQELGLKDKTDILPGLEVRLLPHQCIGVSWMLKQEKSQRRGGIMADDMGLGKTVQMIATMVMNQPNMDADYKTTLIVVPAALLQQWKDEIDTKTNGIFTSHVHHGKDKLKKVSDIYEIDVLITTYQTLNQDFAMPKDVEEGQEAAFLSQHGGVLARARFYRAIADEAQFIRNRATRSSQSLAYVRAKYRWMLTGTPVTNTLADIYGLLRFGQFRPWNDWNDFNEHVAKVQIEDAVLAGERAQAILQPILLRRTKDSLLEGEPILQLPPKTIELVKLEFSEEERDIYDCFEKRTKIRLNKFIRERTLVTNHAAVLVMILRLRQLCCHPHLILARTEEYEDPTLLVASGEEREIGRAIKLMGKPWVEQIKKRFVVRTAAAEILDFEDEAEPEASCPVCQDMYSTDNGRVLECGHEACFDCLLDISNAPLSQNHNGVFGEGEDRQNMEEEKAYEAAVSKGLRPCPTCKKMLGFKGAKVFKSSAFQPSDEELSNYAQQSRRSKARLSGRAKRYTLDDDDGDDSDVEIVKPPSPKRDFKDDLDDSDDELPSMNDVFGKRPAKKQKTKAESDIENEILDLTMDDITVDVPPPSERQASGSGGKKRKSSDGDGPSDAVIAHWRRGDDNMEPSAKMLQLVEELKNSGDDKTIVYSQWTSMLDLIEIMFSRNGIRSLRYDGKMDRASRDATLAMFKRSDGPKVILISTKCGGVGLNLVAANRVVNMDLSWNYAAESQAYDRVHRLGQEKETFIKRLVVRNTIEERMLQLQDVKVGLAEAALGEGTGAKLHKLSIKDIQHLFGMTKEKEDPNQRTLQQ